MHEPYLAELTAQADPERARQMYAYHKADRHYLGLSNMLINDLTKTWRQDLNLADRAAVADGLWRTDIFEARLAAAKLLTQARIRDDGPAWDLIQSWVPTFDSWAIADHAATAGQKRLVAHPDRLRLLETWTCSSHLWTRRAALVMTLPWAKMANPKQHDLEIREQILSWAANYTTDPEWFIQKAVAWWLRDHSKHDPARVAAFLDQYGEQMKPFARKIARKYL